MEENNIEVIKEEKEISEADEISTLLPFYIKKKKQTEEEVEPEESLGCVDGFCSLPNLE